MQHTYTKITDLPDELLIMIFKRLNNIEILQFLTNVNTRFNKIVRDSTFTNHLTLLKCSFNHIIYSLSDTILDKFCIEIIPQIKHNIKWLDIESLSMERILLAAKYPNLNGLGIFNINEEVAQRLFIGLCHYNGSVLPLLHRMINLKKLSLYIVVNPYEQFIDENNLKKNILDHIPQLNEFTFNIRSIIYDIDYKYLLTNEQIQNTFTNFIDNKIISCVDYFSKKQTGQCLIYSYPYRMKYYHNITNNFSGGLFKCVQEVSLFDEYPFEHEFFLRISQSFPFMKKLTVSNFKPQIYKQHEKSNDDNNKHCSIIEYHHLTELDLLNVHLDYVEQFLDETKSSFTNSIYLLVKSSPLRKATHNFTRNEMKANCAKLNGLYIFGRLKNPENDKKYFPNVNKIKFSWSGIWNNL
ncbi:unnamed protein product [Rotaria sordida]|uniref:F-box domain-containing protein n=1 Tax=Rotaria sordida TaxID=392033 RepID=A0A815Q9D8_9BILA|nr:unnamed protein product [Rotaria sordida]